MAANEFELAEAFATLDLRGQSKFMKGLAGVRKSLETVQAKLNAVAKHAQRMLIVAGGSLALFVKIAADAEETASKFNAVFKEGTDAARQWATEFAAAIGRSRFAIEGFLSTFQDTFVPLGFARARAAALSQQLVKLAIDLASFNNIAEEEAVRRLTGALVGEHENVRKFGVVLGEATIKQELLNMGLKGGIKAATEQQKTMARLSIILKATTDAQGDAARTAGSTANQFRALKSQAIEAAVVLGQIFIPIVNTLTTGLQGLARAVSGLTSEQKSAVLTWTIWSAAVLGIAIILPKVIGLVLGLAKAIVALKLAMTFVGGPISVLLGVLALTAAAFINAKAQGISFGESLLQMKDMILGTKSALEELNKESLVGLTARGEKAVKEKDIDTAHKLVTEEGKRLRTAEKRLKVEEADFKRQKQLIRGLRVPESLRGARLDVEQAKLRVAKARERAGAPRPSEVQKEENRQLDQAIAKATKIVTLRREQVRLAQVELRRRAGGGAREEPLAERARIVLRRAQDTLAEARKRLSEAVAERASIARGRQAVRRDIPRGLLGTEPLGLPPSSPAARGVQALGEGIQDAIRTFRQIMQLGREALAGQAVEDFIREQRGLVDFLRFEIDEKAQERLAKAREGFAKQAEKRAERRPDAAFIGFSQLARTTQQEISRGENEMIKLDKELLSVTKKILVEAEKEKEEVLQP